ncbi:MAG: V-type ATP synthase subunit E family protein [Oscillospiraceae bacterium]|nr:V-type ATP synthase subunit E family protein [Oscillospiraceae bacterium]
MQGFEKIIDHIKSESEKECKEIALKANDEGKRVRSIYSQKEQEAYWACVNKGSKEIEKRIESLSELASDQARKKLIEVQQNALDEVLALTARKLSALPSRKYEELLTRLGIEQGCRPEYLVEQYRDELTPSVLSALFDNRDGTT